MKKIFTIIALLVLTLTAGAKDFTDQLAISLNGGDPSTSEATVSVNEVENSDGLYNITLKDFSFESMKIGDVNIEGIKGNSTEGDNGYVYFEETTKDAAITNGGSIAAMLGNKVTVTIKEGSCMNDDKLYLVISLPVNMVFTTLNVDAVFGTVPSTAKTYTDNMTVDLGAGPSDPINATISVEKQENGKYTMQLKNFKFELAPGYALGIGNITINDVEGTDKDGITVLSVTEQPVTITPGDDESVDWSMGEQLAQAGLKATINGEMTDDKLYAVIQLPLASVTVTFGTQISETPSTAKTYTDNMTVDLGAGPSDPINATISVEKQENGKYTMQLKNFKFELAPGYALGIGNITINDVEGTDKDGITVLSVTEQPVTITPGDDESVDWSMGEQLAQAGLKATINGEMTDDKLYAVIQLPLASVTVTFGTQISTNISSTTTSANSGIEAIYDINGNKLNSMKKGLNILKKADGTTVKVIKK